MKARQLQSDGKEPPAGSQLSDGTSKEGVAFSGLRSGAPVAALKCRVVGGRAGGVQG